MIKELVSVIIPTYNRAAWVSRAIDSVLAQTYHPIEILVVDDGSIDNTSAVLSKYVNQITIIRQANQGVSHARNTGLRQVNGEYVAFLDSDDIWGHNKILHQVNTLRQNPQASVCYTWYMYVDENGHFLRAFQPSYEGDVFDQLYFNNFMVTPSILTRRECFFEGDIQRNQFDTSIRYWEDWQVWLKLALVWKFCCVPEYLVCVIDHADRVFKTERKERVRSDLMRIEASLWENPGSSQRLLKLGVPAQAMKIFRSSEGHIINGRWGALADFFHVLRHYPFCLRAYAGIAQTIVGRELVDKAIHFVNFYKNTECRQTRILFPELADSSNHDIG